jgi:hypothetical protein
MTAVVLSFIESSIAEYSEEDAENILEREDIFALTDTILVITRVLV